MDNTAQTEPTRPPIILEPPRDVFGTPPEKVRLFRDEKGNLRLTLEGDRSYLQVKVARAFPLSDPHEWVCYADGKDKQIVIVRDIRKLDAPSRRLTEEELRRRYFVPAVEQILEIKQEFGVVHWSVITDRGPRRFVIRNLRENVQEVEDGRRLVTDAEGNRFLLPHPDTLDPASRRLAERYV
jgi:Domain of unknown function (DUF1854)